MRKSRGVTTYSGAHVNVTLHRGKAILHLCQCGKTAQEWALRHDAPGVQSDTNGKKFSVDPDDYRPMCYRCHRLYDKSAITHCPHGHPYDGENLIIDAGKRKCRTCVYARNRARPLSPASKAKKAEYQRRTRARRSAA